MMDSDIRHLIDLRAAWWATRDARNIDNIGPECVSTARDFIDQVDTFYKTRRIRMLLTPGRRYSDDIVLIFSNDGTSDGLQLSYSILKELVCDYYGCKCAECSISEHDARLRDGRGLELHHVSPCCLNDRAFDAGTITKNFLPLCMRCHPRGIYRRRA